MYGCNVDAMFSIAAINDVDVTQHDWQPLAPTKEAQEFRLTQMYHESLIHLQAGEYKQAQKLLQAIVQDPLSVNAETENTMSSDPMRQLRFLAFRNLAEAFFKQGPHLHKDALQCFLHAVSIDGKDVTLWNRLGSLACLLGSYNIARWSFEQGLQCSPHHWACMEKLVEVLIAIGDESACLSVVKRLLKISPSHPRAVFIRRVIEDNVNPAELKEGSEKPNKYSMMLRGIDKLKPQHYSLSFSKKRNLEDSTVAEDASCRNVLQLNLEEASLTELLSKLLAAIEGINAKSVAVMQGSDTISVAVAQDIDTILSNGITSNGISNAEIANAAATFFLRGKIINEVEMHTPIMEANGIENQAAYTPQGIFDDTEGSSCGKKLKLEASSRLDAGCDRASTLKERDASTDEEPPLERRSTRLERIRTRKFDKSEEPDSIQVEVSKNKVSFEGLMTLLEPYIICKESLENNVSTQFPSTSEEEKPEAIDYVEEREVLCFLREHAVNSGLYHVAQKLLERMSLSSVKPLESWTNLMQLEKCIRSVLKKSSPWSSLFLAEVYMDMASSATGEIEMTGFLEDCNYHLCRILDCIAATIPLFDAATVGAAVPEHLESLDLREQKMEGKAELLDADIEGCWWSFWVRFYWVSGRVRYFQGSCKKSREDFHKCLAILEAREQNEIEVVMVNLPYCKVDKQISAERVRHKLHEVQIQDLLSHSAARMLKGGHYADLIELLAPILFLESGDKGTPLVAGKKHATDFSKELTALDMLVSACEKSEPKNFNVALQCYVRRMHIHFFTAGIANMKGASNSLLQGKGHLQAEGTNGDWFKVVAEEVKRISRCLADFDQKVPDKSSTVSLDVKLLGYMQQPLLTMMCHISMLRAARRSSGLAVVVSDPSEQSEATCFVDAAVAFCRLQHFHSTSSIKEQVELLVRVHDVLAERGLCCAGKACEGGEGVFLKMAIKHFLLLEMKLKAASPGESSPIADETFCESNGEDGKQVAMVSPVCDESLFRADEASMKEKKVEGFEECHVEKRRKMILMSGCSEQGFDIEKRKTDLGLGIALDQSFFCLYGLNLRGGLESSGGQDGLAVHANTSLGDYQTKEQCAEVFQYLLPYARVCTKACLVKLRKVLRAIRQHFPHPPEIVLENNTVDTILDGMDFDEGKLSCMVLNHVGIREILGYALRTPSYTTSILEGQGGGGTFEGSTMSPIDVIVGEKKGSQAVESHPNHMCDDDDSMKSGLYEEVHGNLYYLLTQVEETCASDKWPGFVFTKEGEEFVEQNARLFKYDLLYNFSRFESWHKLANLFDEEVDLMLNDGSKTCSAMEWHKNTRLMKRVETGRRRTRRCLLMSLALAKTPEQESSVHELLALVYYDTLQNVAPSYNQRQHTVVRDSAWQEACQKSFMHFEKALSFKSEWMYLFYLGKLCEKLGEPCDKALTYYQKAAHINPSAVDPLYRLHASRLKLLCSKGTDNLDIIKVVAKYSYVLSTKEQVSAMLEDGQPSDKLEIDGHDRSVKDAWNLLFEDCVKALEVCIEGELKHYHKARFCLAQSLSVRNRDNDIERAKEELGFCFKSNRSLFTINMWEIDGSTKRNRRKTPGSTGTRRGFEILMPESSRKFITCLRKYLLFYLHLCEKTFDLCTLERAYCSLRVDKKFSLCLADMIQIALGKYIHTLGAAIFQFDMVGTVPNLSLKNLLERFFNLFMEHGGSWSDIVTMSLTEAGLSSGDVVSENAIYSYIHRYLHSLECDNKVDILESVNEKIKKRFKTPKLVKEPCARVCKHAAMAWCRALCVSLSAITPLQKEKGASDPGSDGCLSNTHDQLVVELQVNELLSNTSDFSHPTEKTDAMKQSSLLSCMTGVRIKQATTDNMDKVSGLLRQTFTFYRDCTGPFPAGINLFLIPSGSTSVNCGDVLSAAVLPNSALVGVDLSVPRKLLLWAYTLVHGHTCSIAEAVRFCEEQAKYKLKKGLPHASPPVNNQEKLFGSASKEASGSSCPQFNNDDVVEDKEKPLLEDHDVFGSGSRAIPPFSDVSHLCGSTTGLPSRSAEDLVQGEEKSRTPIFEFVDP